jgi:hypothetical protein
VNAKEASRPESYVCLTHLKIQAENDCRVFVGGLRSEFELKQTGEEPVRIFTLCDADNKSEKDQCQQPKYFSYCHFGMFKG